MNKKLIALTLLAVLAEQGIAFAGEYVAAPTYSTYSNEMANAAQHPVQYVAKENVSAEFAAAAHEYLETEAAADQRLA